jgi:hypothetical protein
LEIIAWNAFKQFILMSNADSEHKYAIERGIKGYVVVTIIVTVFSGLISMVSLVSMFIFGPLYGLYYGFYYIFFYGFYYLFYSMNLLLILGILLILAIGAVFFLQIIIQFKISRTIMLIYSHAQYVPQQPQSYYIQSPISPPRPIPDDSSPKFKYCTYCGAKNISDASFCGHCGETFKTI